MRRDGQVRKPREDFSVAGDVDVLVRCADNAELSLFDFVTVADELIDNFLRRVDLGLESGQRETGPVVRDAMSGRCGTSLRRALNSSAIRPAQGTSSAPVIISRLCVSAGHGRRSSEVPCTSSRCTTC